MSDPIPLRLRDRRQLVPGVLHLGFEHAQGLALPFRAGQFVQVLVPDADGQVQRRSYSLANAPDADALPGRWELAVSLMPGGIASALFEGMAPGDTVQALGPFGRFGLQANDIAQRYLLVATGTGVAPLRSMLPELERRILHNGARATLLLGARKRDELPWHDEFLALTARLPGFDYIACITREAVPDTDPHLRAGRVQTSLETLAPRADDLALLCGNPDMVDECFQLLRNAGLPPARIRRERYVASG